MMHAVSHASVLRSGTARSAALGAAFLLGLMGSAQAAGSLRGGAMSGSSGKNSSSSPSATSQTSTTATDTTSQAASTTTLTQHAQAAMNRSIQALQRVQAAQAAARAAALTGANNLGLDPSHPGQTLPNIPDGLGAGGLMPTGGLTQKAGSSIQIINLGTNGNNGSISLGKGGSIVLPKGTPGNDTVTISGAGSITSTGAAVTASSGSITSSTGGTLSTMAGGTITVSGSGSTLGVTTSTVITSTVAGTVTLTGGVTATLPANTAVTVPAGSTIAFTGTGAESVTITGAGTVSLKGAGTLALNNPTTGSGGSITSSGGTVSFTSGVSTTLPAGSTINLNGAGTINVASGTGGVVPVIVANDPATGSANYTTSGTVLSSTGYQIPTSWINIGGVTQSVDTSASGALKVTDTLTQSGQQALLFWDSFNIGKNTTLDFDQSKGGTNVGQWVAINQITDPGIRPSQILGAIQAPGQVYVINQNGIIFGGSSQVNVGALTASSLALNPDYIANGLLNDSGNSFEFQFSDLYATTKTVTGRGANAVTTVSVAPLWTKTPTPGIGGSVTVGSVASGDVTVQAGAQLSSPTNDQNEGGRIVLVGPHVTNNGTISTPDGQTILAAGLQIGFAAHNANDASLRGLDVFVGQVSAPASSLPTTGTFTYNGMPYDQPLTFTGSGQIGTYTAPDGTVNPINAGTPTAIPTGSSVTLAGGTATTAAQVGSPTMAGGVGTVTNDVNGYIESPRADIAMVGSTVNQFGVIDSSTSVTLNGRIDLLADYNSGANATATGGNFFPFATGTVEMGSQSATQILPETSSDETTIGTRLAVSSLVDVQAQSITMDSGSLLYAPGADKPSSTSSPALDFLSEQLTSGVTLDAGTFNVVGGRQSTFANTAGSVTLDDGATIDVSGSENVSASVAENIIPVQLRGPELANSPLQRDGGLRGATVYVDIRDTGVNNGTPWIGTPIGDVSGYVNNVQRTVGELTSNGGTVAINSGTTVSINPNASINVSGGWINYAGANVSTTQVVSRGQVIDISQAVPNVSYQRVYNGFTTSSSKWGVSQSFVNSLLTSSQFEAGYTQGGNGGAISITSPGMSIGGNLYGNTVSGKYQRTPTASLNSTYAGASFLPTTVMIDGVPQSATLNLSFTSKSGTSNIYPTTSPDVTFQTDSFIGQNVPAPNEVLLSQDIVNNDGFGNLSVDTSASGTISVPQGVSLTAPPGGSISFLAANIDLDGNIAASGGGSLNFKVFDFSPGTPAFLSTPAPDLTRGQFTLGADASLDATGLTVDDRATATVPDTLPLALNGGSISISGLDVDLATGSHIDVSGGVTVNSANKVTYGNAGSISILGGKDAQLSSLVTGGQLFLGSTLTGYSGNVGGGGSLTIQSPLVQVGGSTLLNGDNNSASPFGTGENGVASNGTTLWLNRPGSGGDFFSQGGFGSFTMEGIGQIQASGGNAVFDSRGNPVVNPAVLIAANTVIDPTVISSLVNFDSNSLSPAPISQAKASALLPSQRSAVNLVLNAEGVNGASQDSPPAPSGVSVASGGLIVRGDLVMQAGAKIVTDPQTNSSHGVSLLAGKGLLAVLGSIQAPGGTITLTGGTITQDNHQLLFYDSSSSDPFPTVDIGPTAVLSTKGAVELSVNSLGLPTGTVLPGGNISISGNIVAESGAVLDVSGASGTLDETGSALGRAQNQLAGLALTPTRVDSNAGSLTFSASQLFYSDATLLGNAGGPTAQGGSLSVSSGFSSTFSLDNAVPTPADIVLIVTQQGLSNGFSLPSGAGSGLNLLDGASIPGSDTAVGATVNSSGAGEGVFSYFAANSNTFASSTGDHAASNNGGQAGGFASLNLAGTLDFIGPVSIKTSQSINLAQSSSNGNNQPTGGVIYSDSPVTLTAPYIALNSFQTSSEFIDPVTAYPAATTGNGSLNINASVLAAVGNISLQDINTLTFNANGTAGDIRGVGTLQVAGLINLNAAQIYPPTGSTFTIEGTDISITAPTGQAPPQLPLSAGGTLNLFAQTIEQGGILRAPFGVINLGNSSTQSVTLMDGSITSVSGVDPTTGKGIIVPYGIVDNAGTWFDPSGKDITLTGPPAKAVNVNGQGIDIQKGSTIDLAGGGNLFGYQFTPGTGGTQDILASLGGTGAANSFAVLPGYSLKYAPDGTFASNTNLATNGVPDFGYFNANLQVGEQVYLNAGNGLAAGVYTLLPARYALLPGAYLVTPSGAAPGATLAQADGSSLVSGYTTSGLNPATSPVMTGFQVYSQANVLARAPYTVTLANAYFPVTAADGHVSIPRLPEDSGQLVLDATQSMTIQGTLLSQAGAGGLEGEVDIASAEDIYILDTANASTAPTGSLVLDSSQLTDFGAASLLIGGVRTTTDAGTVVDVTTGNIVVDNSAASTTLGGATVAGLAAPDIILASNGTIDVAAGSIIEQNGSLFGGAQPITLQGNGALLRVSSDPNATVSRQGVTLGDTTSLLTIGDGVTIRNANGTAAGSVILDSTNLVNISQSTSAPPVLMSKSLTLDSALINLELGAPATAPTSGLVITQPLLDSLLSSTQSLSLLSYSSIAMYGSGQIGTVATDSTGKTTYQESSLSLHADDIYYADTQNSSGITINAQNVTLDNSANGTTAPSLGGLGTGSLTVNAQTISLGSNTIKVDQFSDVALNADGALLLKGLGNVTGDADSAPVASGLAVGGNLTITTSLITSATSADRAVSSSTSSYIDESISANGALTLQAPANSTITSPKPGALGAVLSVSGGSLSQNGGSIVLPSGSVALQATSGDLQVNGTVDASGVSPTFYNLTKYADGGQVSLAAQNGSVSVTGIVNVSAASGPGTVDSGAGKGGQFSVQAGTTFINAGQVKGAGSTVTGAGGNTVVAQGAGGSESLNVGSLDSTGNGSGHVSSIEMGVTGFSQQTIRDRNDSTVTVDGTVTASNFNLSADKGSINVTGTLDASNTQPGGTGGAINLAAGGSVNLAAGSKLTVAGSQFDDAGKGGSVNLTAGAYEGQNPNSSTAAISVAGQIDLSVGGGLGGTLLLDAPQVTGGSYIPGSSYTPVGVNAAGGGSPTDVAIAPISTGLIQNASSIVVAGSYVQDVQGASTVIDSLEGTAEANATAFTNNGSAIASRIFGASGANVHVRPDEQIDNSTGNLELQQTWDFSALRYNGEPGLLTLRAAGNVNVDFGASINDGFDGWSGVSYTNPILAVGSQSWSYHIVAGADFTAADASNVGSTGSVQIGVQSNPQNPIVLSSNNVNNQAQFFQTIRTGTGDITINAGGDVLLLNNLATIYTAGSQVDPTLGGAFTAPNGTDGNGFVIPATYSNGGGNVTVTAQGNIAHMGYDLNGTGNLVADSSAELPTSWLDREGATSNGQVVTPTTWWVDFTNYFEGIGALGGGNVSLNAGNSIVNVDASVPTNARSVNGALTELGGGDLSIRAGNNIDGGVYYVERGQGRLNSGNQILTNSTRAAVALNNPAATLDYLPTSLFLGQGSFDVSARGDLLLGPVANPFLLPQSFNNIATSTDFTSEISYFSTYASTDAVDASSLGGSVTIRDFADSGQGSLFAWYDNVLNASTLRSVPGNQLSDAQPWLRLAEASSQVHVSTFFGNVGTRPDGSPQNVFGGVTALMPPTLRVTAYTGDIDLVGSVTLSPSPTGTIDLLAAGSINALGVNQVVHQDPDAPAYGSGLINLSDADPALLPSANDPISNGTDLGSLFRYFGETGATENIPLQTKLNLHADIDGSSLHANDPNPAYIYAAAGNISGLTFFSAKQAQVMAGNDISDIGLYIQNNNVNDISVVSAGRDILAYDANTPLRLAAGTQVLGFDSNTSPVGVGAGAPNSGDIQISGPGALEVLAGRDLTLGNDGGLNQNRPTNGDGTFTGLTSVGGQLNPVLPFEGANIVAAAGLGGVLPANGLDQSSLAFGTFVTQFLNPSSSFASTYLPDLASELGLTNATNEQTWDAFEALPASRQDVLALNIFYDVLRDAGRDHNDSSTPGFGNYNAANQAIAALFPASSTYQGDINITSREVKTASGGDINLLTPGGQVIVGVNVAGNQAVDQGILTVEGGNISIFADGDVTVGTSRVFTLNGGDEIIWSTHGNIDAGSSSKTVVSAPPTRVLVDPTSGEVQLDLAGLATGGGIGTLETTSRGRKSNVDLIAPAGTINAGDAGIRSSGNLNIAALKVVNADNISVGGKSSGVPVGASVNLSAVTAASAAAGSADSAAQNTTPNHQNVADNTADVPSIISVEVLGYGGGDQD